MTFTFFTNFEQLLYIFIVSILTSVSILVILSKNPVHSVLFLVLSFFNAAILLLLFQIEFIGVLLIIVYVGAIAVLFIFVVMMLDIKITTQSYLNKLTYLPICVFLFFTFMMEIFIINSSMTIKIIDKIDNYFLYFMKIQPKSYSFVDTITNIETFGHILYTYYFLYFLIAGIILLIALLSAVSLTLRKKKKYNQQIFKQLSRDAKNSVFNFK